MDANPAIWQNDTVRAAVSTGDIGTIVRALRKANNLTLAQFAERCGYSISTLSRMERGKQPLRDVQVLRAFAEALRIPAHVLGLADTRPQSVPKMALAARVGANLAPDEGTDPMRRRTLLAGLTGLAGTALVGTPARADTAHPAAELETLLLNPPPSTGTPLALPKLRHAVTAARSMFQHGSYNDVAARLPRLLPTAHATQGEATNGEDVIAAEEQLAELYTLTTELMVKLSRDHLAAPAVDRALRAAYASGDVLTQATARRSQGIVLRRAGQAGTAHRLIVDTATALQPDLHRRREHLTVYGSLLSTAAYTAAVDGDRDTARTLIDEASRTDPLGAGLYQITIARVLGDAGAAIETARHIHPATIPVVERRARYWADIARAFHQCDKPEQCYRALLAAEQTSSDEVQRKPIQQITSDLLRNPAANGLPQLRAFASRIGIRA